MKTNTYTIKSKFLSISLSLLTMVSLSNCSASRTAKGGAIGAGTGAAIGGIIGNQSDNTAVGAIIGAAVGGTAGALIGRRMDKQAEELRADLDGATVERVGEGIKITFDSGLMFSVDSYNLSASTKTNLANLSNTLVKYDDTEILIEGHTDATGADTYNQDLSEQRANQVRAHLLANDISNGRITSVGYGETQPVADNDSADGRKQNRRVEVAIFANKKMKRAAEKGNL